MIARDATFLISLAAEEFIRRFVQAGQRVAEREKRATVQHRDLGMFLPLSWPLALTHSAYSHRRSKSGRVHLLGRCAFPIPPLSPHPSPLILRPPALTLSPPFHAYPSLPHLTPHQISSPGPPPTPHPSAARSKRRTKRRRRTPPPRLRPYSTPSLGQDRRRGRLCGMVEVMILVVSMILVVLPAQSKRKSRLSEERLHHQVSWATQPATSL